MTEEKKLEPELRFPGFHEPWEEKKLGEDFKKITSGKTKTNKSLGNYPLYGSTGKIKTILNYDYVGEKILIARVGENTGLVNLVDGKYGVTDNTLILDDYDDININYYYYYLDNYDFRRIIIGSGQPLITGRDVKKLNIRLPSLLEQEKIGKFFSTIDKKLDLQRERIKELKSYKKGMMQRIFDQEIRFKDENGKDYPDWEEKKLGEVSNIKTGNSNVKDAIEDGEYTFFDRSIIIKTINKYDYNEEAIIYPGEGSEFYPRYYNGKYALHQRAYSITSKYLNLKYLTYYLMLKNNYFLKMAVGSTVKSLRMENFIKCPVELPSLPEQEKIANFLSAIDKRIELEEEKLELYEDFKKGLMQRMFV